MLELKGNYDIFNLPQEGEAMCVTTNGIVKSNGHAVMGAGIAKTANEKFHLSEKLGSYLTKYGNRAFNLGKYKRLSNNATFMVLSFPTKHNWRDDSDINLIMKSCEELMRICDKWNITKCYITPPGCACGRLDYESAVKPCISQILDDRFIVVLRK